MPPKPLIERARRGPADDVHTPRAAWLLFEPILYNWNKRAVIWECAPGDGPLVKYMRKSGYLVAHDKRWDFFTHEPPFDCDCIITNPPFSQKVGFLRRAYDLGLPFAFILPITALGSAKCRGVLQHMTLMPMLQRIDFTGGGRPWFPVMWVFYKMGLKRGLFYLDEPYKRRRGNG